MSYREPDSLQDYGSRKASLLSCRRRPARISPLHRFPTRAGGLSQRDGQDERHPPEQPRPASLRLCWFLRDRDCCHCHLPSFRQESFTGTAPRVAQAGGHWNRSAARLRGIRQFWQQRRGGFAHQAGEPRLRLPAAVLAGHQEIRQGNIKDAG